MHHVIPRNPLNMAFPFTVIESSSDFYFDFSRSLIHLVARHIPAAIRCRLQRGGFMRFPSTLAAIALGCAIALPAAAQQMTGAGSTFVYPILSKWSEAYSKLNGARVNYQSIGSGGGIAQIKAATVDFGASDAPLAPDQLTQAGLAQFPVASDPSVAG
jgi:ABC-type phosphate transport system substrate-binding protein